MNAPTSITITPVFVADLSAEGERMPVYVHVIDHPDARVLVDTGMMELHPAMADMDPASSRWRAGLRSRRHRHRRQTHTCTPTTAAATTSSPASRSTSSVESSTTRVARTTTPFAI